MSCPPNNKCQTSRIAHRADVSNNVDTETKILVKHKLNTQFIEYTIYYTRDEILKKLSY